MYNFILSIMCNNFIKNYKFVKYISNRNFQKHFQLHVNGVILGMTRSLSTLLTEVSLQKHFMNL